MNPRSSRFSSSTLRLFTAMLCCLPLGSACSSDDDDDASVTPTTFGVEVTSLDGNAPDVAIELRCDSGGPALVDAAPSGGAPDRGAGFFSTLVVAVETTPTELSKQFVLRPAHACGTSTRCGYVRIEGLDESGEVLSSVDTATNEGVLRVDLAHPPSLIRASLIRGLDQKTLQNPDKTDVTTSVVPSFVVPDCSTTPSDGGAGGAAGASSGGEGLGGAGGLGAGGLDAAGGVAGGGGGAEEPGGAAGAESATSGAGGV